MQHFTLNNFDYVILAIIFLSIIVSIFRGFVREIFSLIILLVAAYCGVHFSSALATHLGGFIENSKWLQPVAFAIIFIAIWLCGALLGLLLRPLTASLSFGITNHLLGAIFGALRGIVLVVIMLVFVHMTAWRSKTAVSQSALAPYFNRAVVWVGHYMPQNLQSARQWTER